MLRSMPSTVFAGWLAFMAVEPFGPMRDDYRAGVVFEAVANFAGKTLAKGRTVRWTDAFPQHRRGGKPASGPEEVARRIWANFALAGMVPPQKKKGT